MKAKKLFGILLAGAMALSAVAGLAACGGGGGDSKDADTNDYYLVGSGAGSLAVSNWATEYKPELKLTKDEKKNIFTIEIDLYAGDVFQIVKTPTTTSFWEGQMGFDRLTNPKNAEDEDVFTGTGMFKTDITLQEGFDGRYKVTLETDPSSPTDNSITIDLVKKFDLVTVTYKDGDKVLGTRSIDKGSTLTEDDLLVAPDKLFMTFDGWYKGTELFEGGVVSEALTLTAKYVEDENAEGYTADTNEYYLVGAGQGSLKDSNWNIGKDDNGTETVLPEGLFLKKDESYKQHNVFTIEVTLYAGDQFKIAHGRAWDDALDINNVIDAQAPFEAPKDGTNIVLKSGHDGVYRIILVTDADSLGIYFELIEAKESLVVDYYLVGTYATVEGTDVAFRADPDNWTIHLVEGENNEWTCEVTLTETDYIPKGWDDNLDGDVHAAALKVKLNGTYFGVDNSADDPNGTAGDGNILLPAGTYKITFNSETKEISWELVNEEPAE